MRSARAIWKSSLFKATSLNSLSIALKIAIGLVTSKVIAIFVGPSGMALVGNLRNFLSSLETIGTLGFQNGIIKYTAENKDNKPEFDRILSTVFLSLGVVAVILSLVLFFLAGLWSDMIFGEAYHYETVFRVLAAAMPWYACSLLLVAVINGLGKFREVVYINISGNIIGLLLSVIFISQYHTVGALLAVIVAPALVFFAALFFMPEEMSLAKYFKLKDFSFQVIRKMSSYSLMALVSALISPLVFVAIRNSIIHTEGIANAGYWEAMSRISGYYMMFVSTIVSVYFLPKLVGAKNNNETKNVILSFWKNVLPLFALALLVLYFLRSFVIRILFTKAFIPVGDLFLWQLSGDILKAFSMVLGYNLVAKKHTVAFIVTEFISMAVMYSASLYLVDAFGIEGVVMAHCITYFLYVLALLVFFRKILFRQGV
ncbi:O-antigen translocase [Flavobacterium pallidum]|uniref:O-antigen translocase n=1 Tax=Flavobacterium pallidum TaxID=2172098 RepID=A0A2S1SKY5_9FLAO|nr:O-antigen translocase [Flavobacterium pallidum]AWI27022.1 O-antigen translocase [Flavobacterium pallidum]